MREMCLSLEHQNPSKTSEKWVILIALQFRYTFYRPQIKRLRARKISLQYKIRFDSRISSGLLLLRFPSHSLPSPSDAVHSKQSHVVQVSSLDRFFTRHFVPRSPFWRRAVRQRGYGLRLLIFKMANNKVDLGQVRSEEIVYSRFIKIPLG